MKVAAFQAGFKRGSHNKRWQQPQGNVQINWRTKPMGDPAVAKDTKIQMRAGVPTLLVSDVALTARWYEQQLGFEIAGTFPKQEPYAYASLQRDAVEIMLLSLPGYQKPDLTNLRPEGLWDAYIRMQGVEAFYETVRNQPFIKMPLKQQPYGDWEFEVRDPNGYILVFSG